MCYSGVAPGQIWEQPAKSGIWPKARSDGRRRDWPTFLYWWRHLLLYSGRTDPSSCTSGRICTDSAWARQASGGEAAVAQGHTCCTVGSRSNLAVTACRTAQPWCFSSKHGGTRIAAALSGKHQGPCATGGWKNRGSTGPVRFSVRLRATSPNKLAQQQQLGSSLGLRLADLLCKG
ncbi:unnamed protein product [Urochloa humidicola]